MISSMFRSSAGAAKRAYSVRSLGLNASSVTYCKSNAGFIVGYTVVFGSVVSLMHRRFIQQEARSTKIHAIDEQHKLAAYNAAYQKMKAEIHHQ